MDVEEGLMATMGPQNAGSGPPLQGRPGPTAETGATVPGDTPEAEANVIAEQQWRAIHERRAAGMSVSGISRDLDLDRKTVRSALKRRAWAPYRRKAASSTLLEAHQAWLAERAPKVHYSARILYQELTRERGFGGCYETVKLAVRPLRAEATLAGLTQRRFETAPGEQAQCDWGQVTVPLGGQRVKLHIFVMTLGYSRRGFALGFEGERMPDLLAAHEAAFAYFGGRCEQLLYDRMRTVVLGMGRDAAGKARLNSTFAAFATHWGFTVRLCQPYRAQTKGKVESGVKYVKRNFVPGRAFRDLEDFNAQLLAWQREIADLRVHGTTHEQPIVRFAEEAKHLMPTGSQASFLAAMVRDRVVAEDWLVSIDANRYSVPFRLIGQTVQVVREEDRWVIRHRGRVVAEHTVLDGRAQLAVNPAHGPGAAARNSRQRYGTPRGLSPPDLGAHDVEVRDLTVYEHLSVATLSEAA
jgi:transposase